MWIFVRSPHNTAMEEQQQALVRLVVLDLPLSCALVALALALLPPLLLRRASLAMPWLVRKRISLTMGPWRRPRPQRSRRAATMALGLALGLAQCPQLQRGLQAAERNRRRKCANRPRMAWITCSRR